MGALLTAGTLFALVGKSAPQQNATNGLTIATVWGDALTVRPNLIGIVHAKNGDAVAATVFIATAGPKVGTSPFCPSCYADCQKSAKTDAAGNFEISSLDPQLRFQVLAVAKGFKPKYVNKVDPAKDPIKVTLDPIELADAAPGNCLHGRIKNAKGKPVVGAVVEAHGIRTRNGGGRWGSLPGVDPLAVTDESGDFLITSQKPFDQMDVRVSARGFANKNFTELASGASMHELTLTEGAAIRGRVLFNGQPVTNVTVGVVSVNRDMEHFTGNFDIGTDSDGRFLFVSLPPDVEYYIYGGMDSFKKLGAIPLKTIHAGKDGEVTDIGDLVVASAHRLTGRVVLADGAMIPAKTRLLVSRENAWDNVQVMLPPDGKFDVAGVPAETIGLSLRLPGYRVSGKNASLDRLNPFQLIGRVTGDVTNLVFLMEKGANLTPDYTSDSSESDWPRNKPLRGAEAGVDHSYQLSVTGRVTDKQTGEPLAHFKVIPGRSDLTWNRNTWDAQNQTEGTNGVFSVLVDKKWPQPILKVEADGYLPASVLLRPLEQTNSDFILQPGTGPQGQVVSTNGQPIAKADVLLICDDSEQAGFDFEGHLNSWRNKELITQTDTNGVFHFKPQLGMKSIAVAAPNGFTRVAVEQLQSDPHIMLQPFGTITGVLHRPAGLGTNEDLDLSFVESDNPTRQTINLNREWTFQLGDVAGAAAAFDDAKWDDVNLPHSFSIPYFAAEKFYVGYGWYRKHFDVPAAWTGKRINLEFDGVFQVAEVFVNGQRIGEHKGGYTGFTFDITDAVKVGDNIVAVRVNNLWNARLAPRAGEHVFSGGIYRDVRLVVTAPLHVAWYGTFVTTPQVSKESGKVNVKTEVVNNSGAAKSVTVKTSVLNAKGKIVAQMESTQAIVAGATNVFDQTSAPIANPQLWSPEHPNLYSVQTTVFDDGKAVDDYTSPLGFRWFKFTADQGFFLNGEHLYFKGANVHQDHAGWGDAVVDSGFFRDVKLVKDAGFDFIRGSHYPHAPAFATACDELGMLFWSENCFWGTGGFKGDGYWNCSAYPTNAADDAGFEASVKASLRDMIRINRNHPSIVVWSMSNEPFFSQKSVMSKVQKFLTELVAYSHELDPTRPAAVGGCQRGDIDKLGDVAGYNGDGARLFVNPGVASVVSEYGSVSADRPGKYEPGWGDLVNTPGADKNQIGSWRLPWRSGESIWCAFDHGSIAGRKFGAMGLVDYFRLPKRSWYWYRNEYLHIAPTAWPSNGIPAALKLTADKTTLNSVDGTDDAQIIVTVVDKDGKAINNCPPVTLAVESGPGEFPTGPSIAFASNSDITIRDGMAAIEFRSYYAGETMIRATSPGLKDATIGIVSRGEPKFIAGKTPSVPPRPYVRFMGTAASSPVTLGLENPTRASSEALGHGGRLANDGNAATFWQAAAGNTNAWLHVDLERIVTVSKTKLTFPTLGNWRYQIEISDDGEHGWKMISDQTQNTNSAAVQTLSAVTGARGRFLRVTFVGTPDAKPAELAEVEVTGTLNTQ